MVRTAGRLVPARAIVSDSHLTSEGAEAGGIEADDGAAGSVSSDVEPLIEPRYVFVAALPFAAHRVRVGLDSRALRTTFRYP